jgi:hypothetical protein
MQEESSPEKHKHMLLYADDEGIAAGQSTVRVKSVTP